MMFPSRCRSCGKDFDLADVKVTARYDDCDVFKAPCCGAHCDTRPQWGGAPWSHMGYDDMAAYQRIEGERFPSIRDVYPDGSSRGRWRDA